MIWLVLIILGLIVSSILVSSVSQIFYLLVGIFILLLIVWIVKGVHTVPGFQWWVVENHGNPRVERTGLHWRTPGTERIVARTNSQTFCFDLTPPLDKVVFEKGKEVSIKAAKALVRMIQPAMIDYVDDLGGDEECPVVRSSYCGKWETNSVAVCSNAVASFLKEVMFIANLMVSGHPRTVETIVPDSMEVLSRWGYQDQQILINNDAITSNLEGFVSSVLVNGGAPRPLGEICPGAANELKRWGLEAEIMIDIGK